MKKAPKSGKDESYVCNWNCCNCGTSFWGWFFLIIGLFLIAREYGWIPYISFWPVFLIVLGLYLIISKLKR
ncbi:MAG: DUF5668 domain-containing protein [Candidatus Nanoarchaeia archaeon]|jgi:hypothetical protein|nr:DUF5668 domain-containing protein [Candidatus Nanoarchaeia archaeon]|tara:strand:+ start:409 stop:621 length:213 start_codon:yes stop_codon:yes gene_type:complete